MPIEPRFNLIAAQLSRSPGKWGSGITAYRPADFGAPCSPESPISDQGAEKGGEFNSRELIEIRRIRHQKPGTAAVEFQLTEHCPHDPDTDIYLDEDGIRIDEMDTHLALEHIEDEILSPHGGNLEYVRLYLPAR